MAANGGKILFVGTKRSARDTIKNEAERCGMPYVNNRWLGGMLTNFHTVKQSIKRLNELEEMLDGKGTERLGKREILQLRREVEKLHLSLGGIKDMNILPDVLFVIDVGYEEIAVKEAVKLGIPVVAVVDTNNPLHGVDYVIPGNDDAIRSIQLYAANVADAIIEAKDSVATLSGDEDEFVEVKETDDSKAQKKKAVVKKKAGARAKPKAKAAAEDKPEEKEQTETASDDESAKAEE
jgi:small subunit ribosomal protein S2